MKLKEFLENINAIVESNPKSLELDVVYSIDDEGNRFKGVFYSATLGFKEDEDFTPLLQFKESGLNKNDINSICIN